MANRVQHPDIVDCHTNTQGMQIPHLIDMTGLDGPQNPLISFHI